MMLINNYYSSVPGPCGIQIFSRHLREALLPHGVKLFETNLRTATEIDRTPTSLVQYVPSAFASPESSRTLIQLLASSKENERIFVILHGLHGYGEDRFRSDTICPDQERHISLILDKAESIIVLSESVAKALRTWQLRLGGKTRFLRLDHPGLYTSVKDDANRDYYAFLGGISRSKKNHTNGEIDNLIGLCDQRGIRIWQHWTNVQQPQPFTRAWRQTYGLVTDRQWGSLVSCAQVVLCPYQTQIQSVSGLVSEALSAQRFVLATSFELALEMQQRVPTLVCIEDDLHHWPDLILQLVSSRCHGCASIPTWDIFARCLIQELFTTVVSFAAYNERGTADHETWQRFSIAAKGNKWRVCGSTFPIGTCNELHYAS